MELLYLKCLWYLEIPKMTITYADWYLKVHRYHDQLLLFKLPSTSECDETVFLVWSGDIRQNFFFSVFLCLTKSKYLHITQPRLIGNTHLCQHFCNTIPYCSFLSSFKVNCPVSGTKTCVQYVSVATFLLCWYRQVLWYFYYVASGTYCGGSEFKCLGSVAKSLMLYCVGKWHTLYTKPNPKPR